MQQLTKLVPVILTLFIFVSCQEDKDVEEKTPLDQQGQLQQEQFQQTDINPSDEELEQFIDGVTKAQEVQMGAQQKMISIIEDENMDVETYSKIAQSMQMDGSQTEGELDVSDQDMQTYEKISSRLEEVQTDIDQEVNKAIEKSGMELERFEQINAAVQQDPDLQQRIREKMQEMQPMQQQPSQ